MPYGGQRRTRTFDVSNVTDLQSAGFAAFHIRPYFGDCTGSWTQRFWEWKSHVLTDRRYSHIGAGNRTRTYNLLITNQLRYHCAIPAYTWGDHPSLLKRGHLTFTVPTIQRSAYDVLDTPLCNTNNFRELPDILVWNRTKHTLLLQSALPLSYKMIYGIPKRSWTFIWKFVVSYSFHWTIGIYLK